MANGAVMDMIIVAYPDQTLEVFAPGQLPVGQVVANPRRIRVSGPAWVAPPAGRLTAEQFQDWQANLQPQGYTITDVA
jgi:hypothetical protein